MLTSLGYGVTTESAALVDVCDWAGSESACAGYGHCGPGVTLKVRKVGLRNIDAVRSIVGDLRNVL